MTVVETGVQAVGEVIRVSPHGPDNPFVPFRHEDTNQSIPQRFEQVVRLHGSRVAVKCGDVALTYDELNRQANRMARALLAQHLPPGMPVAILLSHDIGPLVSLLGALKAGIFYCVLDPFTPRTILTSILADAQASLIIADEQTWALGRSVAGDAIPMLNPHDLDGSLPVDDPHVPITPDALAFIVYTSGSSGQPKGVLECHRSRLCTVRRHTNDLHVCPDDRQTFITRYAHVAGVAGLFRCLLNGAALLPFDVRTDGFEAVPAWLAQERVTILHAATTVFRRVAGAVTAGVDLSPVRIIHLTGEPVLRNDVTLYQATFAKSCRLVGVYGSSETGTISRGWMDHSTDATAGAVPAGYAHDGVTVRCLGADRSEVERGRIGEVAVSSTSLAAGYWRKPELTSRRFVTDGQGSRFYLTGDLGLMLDDGCLVLRGRKDFQIKIRGLQVDVSEVESALLGQSGVKEACVAARSDTDGTDRLVAYIVPSAPRPTVGALRRALAGSLQQHMVPTSYVFLDALPLTATNKVDRLALPEPGHERPILDDDAVAPRTPDEATMCHIWQDLLKLDNVGIRDDFFDLGGHSLLAIRLFTHIEQVFAVKLPATTLLDCNTVEKLAQAVRRSGAHGRWQTVVPIQPQGTRPALFCVHGFGGGVMGYAGLARLLGPDQPFYGLQAKGLNGAESPHESMEDMAAFYVSAVRAVQPHGPYHLAGYCYGGVVAYEMARQLANMGETVAHLALLEASAPNRPRQPRSWQATWRLARNLPYWMIDFWQRDRSSRPLTVHIRNRAATALQMVARRRGQSTTEGPMEPAISASVMAVVPDAVRMVVEAHRRAIRSYRPQPYQGQVTLYRVRTQSLFAADDPTSGWGRLASGGVDVRRIAGAHYNILEEPHVHVLADKMGMSLSGTAGSAGTVSAV